MKAWIGIVTGIGSVITVIIAMVWGVPYYVDIKVEQRVNQLNAAAGTPPEVTQLQTDVQVLSTKIDAVGVTASNNGQKLDALAQNVMDVYAKLSEN